MSNQSNLPPIEELPGSSGPIDLMFEHWLQHRIAEGNPIDRDNVDQMAWIKFIFFTAVCEMYNASVTVIRGDASLRSFSYFSEGVRQNYTDFIQSLGVTDQLPN